MNEHFNIVQLIDEPSPEQLNSNGNWDNAFQLQIWYEACWIVLMMVV